MKRLLCPSMMCANYGHLAAEVRALDDAGADIFHCDIMDGSFVPNFTMGVMDVQTIRRYTDKPVDCHLMIENPGSKVDWFIRAGANIIYIHPESERYVVKTLAHIKEMGAAAGIAVKTVSVAPDPAREKFAGVEEAGYRGFRLLAGSGRLSPDVALFVSDDYLARGALLAMAESGLRPPEDFRLAIWSNAGIAPYFPREISRMEAAPATPCELNPGKER